MIKYQLICQGDHTFESWFANSDAYETLTRVGEVTCPVCGSDDVRKAIMAPNVSPATRRKSDASVPAPLAGATGGEQEARAGSLAGPASSTISVTPRPAPAPPVMNAEAAAEIAQFVEAVRTVKRELMARADDVGDRFADEARKIHYEETEARPIYGTADQDEVRELAEEGIDFFALPTLPEERN